MRAELALLGVWAVLSGCSAPESLSLRMLAWGDADVDDHRRFPARVVDHAPPAHAFAKADPARMDAFGSALVTPPGLDEPVVLDAFMERTDSTALLVLRGDRLVFERYYNGADATSICTSFSIAKSFASALVGAAIADGSLGGLDDRLVDHVPELLERDPRFAAITLRHLVTMSSGLRYVKSWNPFVSDDPKTYYDPDLRARALSAVVEEEPGTRFLYNNYNPLLIGMVLERATGRSVSDYLSEKIWRPLGMEASATWSLDSESSGFEKMESGLNARAIDFLKFAALYRRGGMWNGVQVLPRTWVEESTRHDDARDPATFYQYFWWVRTKDEPPQDYWAEGNKGQFLYVCPERDVVIARFGREYGFDRWPELLEALALRVPPDPAP